MRYRSTRALPGQESFVSFEEAALSGLAGDGGLYVPETLPLLDLKSLHGLAYSEVAWRVMQPLCDLPLADLQRICREAYPSSWSVAPLVSDPWGHRMELFHGPTFSFKDVALQFLGRLLQYYLEKRGSYRNLLVATSGDTGSAALCSVVGRSRLQAVVMYPRGRVSRLQQLQMTSVVEPNTHCLEIEGTFDDCQAILKELNRDLAWKEKLQLGAVNSVNWARLLAQLVYYVWAHLQLGQPLQPIVPTGNFGNVLSAWLAWKMGVPTAGLVIATNENDIVHRFFASGRYERGAVHETLAPAMDIQVASNLERLFYFCGQPERVQGWMKEFEASGRLTAGLEVGLPIDTGRADRGQILEGIRRYREATGEVLCPHTAVAWQVARQVPQRGPQVIVATAHSGKFPEAVAEALGEGAWGHPALEALEQAPRRSTPLPARAQAVRDWMEGLPAPGT